MSMRALLVVCFAFMWQAHLFGADKKLKLVTTFLPAYCFTVNVAGDAAEVENLLPSHVSPHEYQLSPRDMRKLSGADFVVMNGLGIEAWMNKALTSAGIGPEKTIVLSKNMEKALISGAAHHHHHDDKDHNHSHDEPDSKNPHIWLDPQLAIQAVQTIAGALSKADTNNASIYAANAAAYIKKLTKLNEELAQKTAAIQKAPFVTYHNAFAYLANRYGLQIAAVVQETPDVNPSARDVKNLLNVIRQKKVKAIFTEPQSSPKLARQLARDAGIATANLDTLETGELNADAYEHGMRKNVETLLQHLR
ncbi:MAG: metal ABC transporter substrate-binding protein [Verrucomicrobiales bacterium]